MASRGDTIYVVYKELPEDKGHMCIKHSYDAAKRLHRNGRSRIPAPTSTRFPTVAIDLMAARSLHL